MLYRYSAIAIQHDDDSEAHSDILHNLFCHMVHAALTQTAAHVRYRIDSVTVSLFHTGGGFYYGSDDLRLVPRDNG